MRTIIILIFIPILQMSCSRGSGTTDKDSSTSQIIPEGNRSGATEVDISGTQSDSKGCEYILDYNDCVGIYEDTTLFKLDLQQSYDVRKVDYLAYLKQDSINQISAEEFCCFFKRPHGFRMYEYYPYYRHSCFYKNTMHYLIFYSRKEGASELSMLGYTEDNELVSELVLSCSIGSLYTTSKWISKNKLILNGNDDNETDPVRWRNEYFFNEDGRWELGKSDTLR